MIFYASLCGKGAFVMGMEWRKSARMPGETRTYFINDVVKEDIGGGNVRIENYALKRGILVREFDVIMSASRLLTVGRTLSEFAEDIFHNGKIHALRMDGTPH